MAWRYPAKDFQDGDVVSAEDWNDNLRPFIEEINGGMDRDNLPGNSIVLGDAVNSTRFNTVTTKNTAVTTALLTNSQAWQDTPLVNTDVPTNIDALFIVEACVQWEHNRVFLSAVTSDDAFLDHLEIDFQLTVDGFQIAYGGPYTALFKRGNIHLCGAMPVSTGAHEVRLQVRVSQAPEFNDDTNTWAVLDLEVTSGELIITERLR